VTGFLTQQPPRGEGDVAPPTADTGVVTQRVEDLQVLVVVAPGPGLQREVIVQIQDQSGEPVDLYDAPALSLSSADVDLGEVPVVPTGAGTYTADVVFPVAGAWEAQVSVKVDEFDSPVVTVGLDV
jgi:copper transport protein